MRFSLLICLILPTVFYGQGYKSSVDSFDIEDIIIAASRVSNDAPASYVNIDQADIDAVYVGQDPVILLERLTPSIVSYSDGGTDIGNYSQFRLRGIDQDRLNISLNGVPLNDMVDHGTFFSNFSDFGNSVESIQVIRGVGANSVGAASYGGSVNFESANLFKNEGNYGVQVTAGSFGTLRTAAEAQSGFLNNKFGVYTRMSRTVSEGYKDNSGTDSYSLFFSGGMKGENDVLKITAFAGKTQNGQSYEHVPLSIIEENPRTNFNNLNDVDDFEQNMVQVQYAKVGGALDYIVTAYYQAAGGVFPYTFAGDQFMFGLDNNQFGLQLNGTQEFETSSISFGVNAYTFDRTNFEFISPFRVEPYYRDFTDKNELSVYGKYQMDINNLGLYVNAELRTISMNMSADETVIDPFNMSHDYTFFNGSIGLNYQLNEGGQLYISYGETSREPTRSDILNGVTDDERVHDIEIGYRLQQERFSLESNLFYLNFDNEISKIGALVERSYMDIRQNVPNSIRQGLELAASYDASEQVKLGLNLTYMSTNIDEYVDGQTTFNDVEHIFAPNWIINPNIDISFSNRVSLNLNARYVSESFTELSNSSDFLLPSFTVMNAQLRTQLSDQLSLNLVLNNVFDALYFTEGSPIDADFDGITEEMGFRVQPPRNFYIMANYQF